MNRSELTVAIMNNEGMRKIEAEAAVDAVLKAMIDGIVMDGSLLLLGFGNFTVTNRPERDGHNPSTGEPIKIAASRAVKFTTAKALKAALNPPPITRRVPRRASS